MTTLKDMKRELTMAKAERSMHIRRGESTAEIDAKIASIKAQIAATGATVAEVNVAGRFATDNGITDGELVTADIDLMGSITSKSWATAHPWQKFR